MKSEHIPVMEKEVVEFFAGMEITTFFEGTVGAGGHAQAILRAHPEIKHYLGCDLDPEALEIARDTLSPWKEKVELIHGNFSQLDEYVKDRNVDGFFLI